MADRTSRLIVRLVDGVSGPAARAASGLRQLLGASAASAIATRGTFAALNRDVGMIRRGTERITGAVSMPLALIGAYGAHAAYQFQKAGNDMQAVTRISDEQRAKIEQHVQALNALFPANNSEIMGAAFELGRAGLKFEQIMGSLKGTLQLGLAGDLDLSQAADIATNVLTAMRLPTKTAEQTEQSLQRVNDVLAYVATNSNTDVRMMGETFKYVGPMAAAASMSIEQVGAASMLMAKNGIRASEAGVAMRSALVRMVRPTKPMIAALERLNLDVADFVKGGRQITGKDVVGSLMADGIDASPFEKQIDAALANPKLQKSTAAMTAAITNIIGEAGGAMDKGKLAEAITDTLTAAGSEVDLIGFMAALREKGADLGDIARIFDARQGARLITLLAGDLGAAVDEIVAKAKGATDEMAQLRMKGIVGDVAELSAAWENMFIKIAEAGVLKDASNFIKSLTQSIQDLAKSNPELLRFGTHVAIAAVALAPLSMAISALAGVAGVLVGILGLIASPILLVVVAAIAAGAAIAYFKDEIAAFASTAATWAYGVASNIATGLAKIPSYFTNLAGQIASAVASGTASLFAAGAQLLQSLWEGLKSKAGEILAWAAGLAGRIGSAISSSVGMGGASAGASAGAAAGAAPPARARGGHVSRGNSYLVGEHRPEIFTPGQSGYITPRSPRGGGAGTAQPINFAPVLNINGAGDPQAVADHAVRMIENRMRELFRGIQGDTRTNFAY